MSVERGGEIEPDAAALDELLRAFTDDDPVPPFRRAPDEAPPDDDHDEHDHDEHDAGEHDAGEHAAGEPEQHDAEPDELDDDDEPDDVHDETEHEAGDGARSTVISIADDELPDAVYVEGDLGGPGKRAGGAAVVFIEDDESGDTVALGPRGGASGGIEPRLRDRRNAVRRAAGRKRLRWVVVVAAVVVVVVAVLAVLGSPLFSIDADELTVTGAVYTDPERLDAVIDDLVGTPVLVADTRAAEAELESIAWVESARVRTHFPRGASIEIRERRPLATYQGPDGRFRVIDRAGRVLDVLDGQPIAYMLITGPDPIDLEAGAFAPPGYAAAAELVQALTATVRGQVTSIDVTADGSQLGVFLADGLEVRFGAANDLLVKLVRLENVLPSAIEDGARLVDVSTAEVTRQ